jgi:hypothetical protein
MVGANGWIRTPKGSTDPTMCTCMEGYGPQYQYLSSTSDTSGACSSPGQVLLNDKGRICRLPYNNQEDSTWIISAGDANTKVAVVLTALDTGRDFDLLYIDGCSNSTCVDSWSITEWSGTLDQYYLRSAADMPKVVSRVVQINFVSDDTQTRSG